MAVDFIKVDTSVTTAVKARELLECVRAVRTAYEQLIKALETMGHLNDGTTFTSIETVYGLPAGTGQTVFNLVNGAKGSFEGTFQVADAKNLSTRLVG